MKTALLAFLFLQCAGSIIAQNSQHEQIGKLEWDIKDFTPINNLTELDTGSVNYILTLNRAGKIKRIEILSNTFATNIEQQWRNYLKKSTFTKSPETELSKVKYKGTFLISRARCNNPVGTVEQIQLFRKQ
jgi:hypothetical protein